MAKCEKCIYFPKCGECPFDESGCKDFVAKDIDVPSKWIPITERLPKHDYIDSHDVPDEKHYTAFCFTTKEEAIEWWNRRVENG